MLYQLYPLKVGKVDALRAIERAIARVMAGDLQSPPMGKAEALKKLELATVAFAKSPAGKAGRFTPHPATWYNKGRYDDDPATWNRVEESRPRPGEFQKPKPVQYGSQRNG